MNVSKSELKMQMAQDLGKKFEERETALMAEAHRLEGAQGALKQAAEKFESVKAFYQKEVDEGKFEEKDLEIVMRAIDRCRGVVLSLADVAQAQKLMKQGEAQESKRSLDLIEKMYQDERDRLAFVLKGIEDGTITKEEVGRAIDGSTTLRVVDGRPTNDAATDLASRRAAARAEREGKTEALPQATPSSPQKPQQPASEELAKAAPEEDTAAPTTAPQHRRPMVRRKKT